MGWLGSFYGGSGQEKASDKGGKENERLKQRVAELEKLLGAVRTVISFGKSAAPSGQQGGKRQQSPKGEKGQGSNKGNKSGRSQSPQQGQKNKKNQQGGSKDGKQKDGGAQ